MSSVGDIEQRLRDVLRAACRPRPPPPTSVTSMGAFAMAGARRPPLVSMMDIVVPAAVASVPADAATDALVIGLYREHASSLVRLARLFVDDRNAAEDLVQEAFIRLARSAHRIEDESKAAAYLRSIVLNLAGDNNRRGLVSLRHHLPLDDRRASTEDEIELQEDQREVIEA